MFEDVICPYCSNPVNSWHPSHWVEDELCCICECWSGQLDKEEPRHLFAVFVRIRSDLHIHIEQNVNVRKLAHIHHLIERQKGKEGKNET